MRVSKRPDDPARTEMLRQDLTAFLRMSEIAKPVCGPNCPKNDTQPGDLNCSRNCPDVSHALSSEPERFPIEEKIAPLVFEMKRTGAFYPCWSCEGHLDPSGKLHRTPAVWFFCDNVLNVRLLSDGAAKLHAKGQLSCRWRVEITYTESDTPDTTFALEPVINDRSSPTLTALQDDAALLAREMQTLIRGQAQDLLWSLDK